MPEGPGSRHFVDPAPFDPGAAERLTPDQERYFQASQWRIIWWRFRRHRIAMVSLVVLALFYLCVPFAEPIAPYDPNKRNPQHLYAPVLHPEIAPAMRIVTYPCPAVDPAVRAVDSYPLKINPDEARPPSQVDETRPPRPAYQQ